MGGDKPVADVHALVGEAQLLANASSTLSDRLTRVEAQLQSLPAKIEVRVEDSVKAPEHFLRFGRRGDEWGLSFGFQVEPENGERRRWEWKPVTECSVHQKALASVMLPQLINNLVETIEERVQGLKDAHAALDEVDELLASLESNRNGRA